MYVYLQNKYLYDPIIAFSDIYDKGNVHLIDQAHYENETISVSSTRIIYLMFQNILIFQYMLFLTPLKPTK